MNVWVVDFCMNHPPTSNIAVLPTVLPLPGHVIEAYPPFKVCTGKPGNEANFLLQALELDSRTAQPKLLLDYAHVAHFFLFPQGTSSSA